MAKKKTGLKSRGISNRRARFDYELDETFVVGLQLTGAETKALRLGMGRLSSGYVIVKDAELWLIGAEITGNNAVQIPLQDKQRSRKLLAHKKEIEKLAELKKQGKAIVPLEIITRGRYIKLKIGAGKGRKRYDKREVIKRREQNRDIARRARI